MIIKCIIIDDEPLARTLIEGFCTQIPDLQIEASFEDPVEAAVYLQNNEIDLVFCDIQMPTMNGFELLNSLAYAPKFIMITAFREHALDGFEAGVLDYLVKPVRFDRVLKAVNKAKEYMRLQRTPIVEQIDSDRIFIKSDGRLIKILFSEILYLEAQGDYVKIVAHNDSYTTQITLKSMEAVLPEARFFRIQRSFILNLEALRSIHGNMVELTNGNSISIASSRKEELYNRLGLKGY